MFDFVRKHNRIMQVLLFLLIVPSFVLFGLEGYNRFRDKGEAVARVDGREITQGEWDAAHRRETERIRALRPQLDAKLLDSPPARYAALENLVRERVLGAAAQQAHLQVSDQRLAREMQRSELMQAVRTPDGRVDMERYRQLLASQGMTPEVYENSVRQEIAMRHVLAAIGVSGFAPASQANVSLGRYFEKREVQIATFEPKQFAAKIEPTDAELEAFHKAHPAMFQAPEQANVEYLVLDLEAVKRGIAVNEQDLKTYYEQNIERLSGKEERRASHILVTVPKGASGAEKEKAKAKAAELLAQVKKAPDTFADVAKKNSQDPGSAPQGGDLDFFNRDAMVKPFSDAAFKMNKGEISDLVESEFGFHIIKLTDVKTPKRKTFEEMRPEIEAEQKKQLAQRKYSELAETFSNTVYEQSDSLKPAADKLKLEIKSVPGAARKPLPGATGPMANEKFLGALFSPDSIERKRNTEAMEIAPSVMVSGRISQYTPARTRPLAEVKAEVRERVIAERAAELARKEGAAKLAAWKAAPASAALGAPLIVSRQDGNKQPRELVEAVMRSDAGTLPALQGVDLGAAGYAVVRINKVLPREAPSAAQAQSELGQYVQAWSAAESVAYYNLLKDRFKVQISVPRPKDQ